MSYYLVFLALTCILLAFYMLTVNLDDSNFIFQLHASKMQFNLANYNTASVRSLGPMNITDSESIKEKSTPGVLRIPYDGLVMDQVSPDIAEQLGLNKSTYAIVSEVIPNSPAEEAGFEIGNKTRSISGEVIKLGGDIILEIDGNKRLVRNNDAYLDYLHNEKEVHDNITFTILRDGKLKELNLTVGALPEFLTFENQDEGIKIAYPSDWTVLEQYSKQGDIVRFFAPEENPSNGLPAAGVFIQIFPAGEFGLDTLARQERLEDRDTRNLRLTFTELGRLPAYESIFYDYENQNRTLKMLSIFTIKDGKLIYRINFAADPWNYNEYLPLARKMIESFQFISKT